ncbi:MULTISPECIES: hypothetical protein [Actinoalloteichus]|uniref:Lipoprotein n=1 Tax=Actinoalloteichus caeruleus DSM 43889 TaxID=1120930 RepID=A0ABT1JE47_ACTCY|nr:MULTISPECIES: hypothetical protein [Actinoalloteichus]MCP2330406.1 hypothetical protein [Actinoalloteichus caeruleus DSM 43889]
MNSSLLTRARLAATGSLAAVALVLAGCGGGEDSAEAPPPASTEHAAPSEEGGGHDDHDHEAAEETGAAAMGQSFDTALELASWVAEETGECADPTPASEEEFRDFVGPLLIGLYEPYVAEWATCAVPPHDKLGLVIFDPDRFTEFQESWRDAVEEGEVRGNPDWSFGNGFAVTSGPTGAEEMGLHYLWCAPVDIEDAHLIPADAEGCDFAHHGHH